MGANYDPTITPIHPHNNLLQRCRLYIKVPDISTRTLHRMFQQALQFPSFSRRDWYHARHSNGGLGRPPECTDTYRRGRGPQTRAGGGQMRGEADTLYILIRRALV